MIVVSLQSALNVKTIDKQLQQHSQCCFHDQMTFNECIQGAHFMYYEFVLCVLFSRHCSQGHVIVISGSRHRSGLPSPA